MGGSLTLSFSLSLYPKASTLLACTERVYSEEKHRHRCSPLVSFLPPNVLVRFPDEVGYRGRRPLPRAHAQEERLSAYQAAWVGVHHDQPGAGNAQGRHVAVEGPGGE